MHDPEGLPHRPPARAGLVLALIAFGTSPAGLAQMLTTQPAWLPPGCHYDAPFFPDAAHDPTVPTPDQIIGFRLGTRPALHSQVEACLMAWSDGSQRLLLREYARSFEQRPLYYAVITSSANHQKLEQLREANARLADPRTLAAVAEAERLIAEAPGIAWLAYCIHGDELSGTDAALAVLHHLIAAEDEPTRRLLDELVIIIDPLQNPDGRNRFIRQTDEVRGHTPSVDPDALQHSGFWPYGRSNHYLFDMNRDWVPGISPETRGRRAALALWNPQLLVDGHEMGAHDTYLFYPPREPFAPHISEKLRPWWQRFAADQGAAFDRHGWSYYTREWADFWYTGYTDSWAAGAGAVAILYEQAGTGGGPIRQASGSILTYREAVHHQVVSSLANLETFRQHRAELLRDFHDFRRAALAGPEQTYVLVPAGHPTRERALVENLVNQGIEVGVARTAFQAPTAANTLRDPPLAREFPAGSYVIPVRQPRGGLVRASLEFDPRLDSAFVESERRELETKHETRMYDVTAWSLPLAAALDAWRIDGPVTIDLAPVPAAPAAAPAAAEGAYGYVIDGQDDAALRALAHLLQAGVVTRVAQEPFQAAGQRFARGSLLIRRHENTPAAVAQLTIAAQAAGVAIHSAMTARSPDDGPDLGGGRFTRLEPPRVALFGREGVDSYSYGSIWHQLDYNLGLSVALLDARNAAGYDLRKYNVIVLPNPGGAAEAAYGGLAEPLKTWVQAGGTLVAVSGAASWLADEKLGFSQVRRRGDVLNRLPEFAYAAEIERVAGARKLDLTRIWDNPIEELPTTLPTAPADSDVQAKLLEERRSIFAPTGAICRTTADAEHWLTSGCPRDLPAFVAGSSVLVSDEHVETPVRFAPAARLRLSGLVWPEAGVRLGDSAFATVERLGHGQVILLAQEPCFRGMYPGTARLLSNAVLLGPGCGAATAGPY